MHKKAGEQIRALRLKSGMTQEELAEKIDSSQKYISGVENGHRKPSLDFYRKVAEALAVSLDSILQPDLEEHNSIYTNTAIVKMKRLSEEEQKHIVEYIELFSNFRDRTTKMHV